MLKFTFTLFAFSSFLFSLCAGCGKSGKNSADDLPEGPSPVVPSAPTEVSATAYGASSWTAEYASGQKILFDDEYPAFRPAKKVGIFYFIWHGSHGYDQAGPYTPGPATPAVTDTQSPYDITELLRENPSNPAYGPFQVFHHWGKPYFDYYVSDDNWVLRKHAQMLTDAGIDVILVDVTNAFCYEETVRNLCDLYLEMQEEGNPTPQIAFVTNASAPQTVKTLFDNFYANAKYAPLWFQWDGKPLILAPLEENYDPTVANYFTMRYAWFDSGLKWFGDGEGKWCWGDYYPQSPGLKNGKAEAISVMPATHPHKNLGRSYQGEYPNGTQPENPSEEESGMGRYFSLQCQRALEVDPDFVFITGWNEWVAQRQIRGLSSDWDEFLGKPLEEGGTYFVDQYNHEFSRDLEPVADGFRDNYYYYMVDFIRKFKGVNRVRPQQNTVAISVDGAMEDWADVTAVYADNRGDVTDRDHFGWGRVGRLVDNSGRNDIVMAKVATDGTNLYFYVRTYKALTPYTDSKWMRLFISVENQNIPDWEGFGYVVNNKVKSSTKTYLQSSLGGWSWGSDREIDYAMHENELEVAVPLAALGISDPNRFTIDFKWIDNSVESGDICECMKYGDSAPNSRFRYRFSFEK